MTDARAIELAGRQFNRVSRAQLLALGMTRHQIAHRVGAGRLVAVEQGVFAFAPVLDDPWGRFMGATLTASGSLLSRVSAGAAWGMTIAPRQFETITRPGTGGPRRFGGVLVFRSTTLDGDRTMLRGVPITTAQRTLLDLAATLDRHALARALRDALRLKLTTTSAVTDRVNETTQRPRGSTALLAALSRYAGPPLHRARSGAEVRALELLRDAHRPPPNLNVRIAGAEADLSWPDRRLIVEIDGKPFHLDVGEDARKQALWEAAGWTVKRIASDTLYDEPERLLALVTLSTARMPRIS